MRDESKFLRSMFTKRQITKTERQLLRERAYNLLRRNHRERVLDILLIDNQWLSWRQADLLVRQAERALKG